MACSTSIWPPVLYNLSRNLQCGDSLVLAFAPYIKSDALEVFLDTFSTEATRIIVRWKVEDLLAGASDLGIFRLLESRGIELYLHPKIHLKLFEFSSGVAYTGSSNITKNGLSLGDAHNEEMGVLFQLDASSYTNIRRLCDESRKVTKEIVDAYKKAIDESKINPPVIGELVLPPEEPKEFLVSDLPASESPQAFTEAVSKYLRGEGKCTRMLHDMGTFRVSESELTRDDLENMLIQAFRSHRFVKRIVQEIRCHPSINFGAVTAFVQKVAQDVPLPYRSSIKEAVARLYPWLEFCFEDISYSTPGHRSQVIRSSLVDRSSVLAAPYPRRRRKRRRS